MFSHVYRMGVSVAAIFQNGRLNYSKFQKFKGLVRSSVHLNIHGHIIVQMKGLWEPHILSEILGVS